MSKYIEIKQSWEGAARSLIVLLNDSATVKGKKFAEEEIIKMGKALDKSEKVLEKINSSITKVDPIVGANKKTAAMN